MGDYNTKRNYDAYFDHLIDQITSTGKYDYDNYICMLRRMYTYDFHYYVPMDQNRIVDVIDHLRRPFWGDDAVYHIGQVKVLEILVALAIRVEEHIEDEDMPSRDDLFHEMLENLGLLAYSDDVLNGPRSVKAASKVSGILHDFVKRKYDANGRGGIFPLMDPPFDSDLREVDLWYQAMWYICERYNFED